MTSVTEEHKKGTQKAYRFAIITVSTSRYRQYGPVDAPASAEDISGDILVRSAEKAGHILAGYSLIPDDEALIREAVRTYRGKVDVIITTGGTGLAASDVTLEALVPVFEKEMPGFGELFRFKSIDQIGPAVILTRASAGTIGESVVFCLPGSPKAVELAMEEIILPEVGHVIRHLHG
jgi:molybdenum cofactor biosynthesis protein B